MRFSSAVALMLAASLSVWSSVEAQRPRGGGPPRTPSRGAPSRPAPPPRGLSGTLSPRAIGRPALTPAPIGGLRTRPLTSPFPPGVGVRDGYRDGDRRDGYGRDGYGRDRYGRDGYRDSYRDGYRDGYPRGGRPYGVYGYPYGYGVADAPLVRGGVIYYDERVVSPVQPARTWFPTVDKPRWRRDSTVAPVQAWIDLIVEDVVCDGYGTCMERESRARAPWVAVCRCYIFTDALGRRWEIQ